MIDMVAADGEPVAIAAEQKHMQIGPGETDARREWDGAAMDVMRAVAVDEIRKARRTTDACESNDLFVLEVAFLEHLVERGEHGEIAAPGTPCWMIGGDRFFSQFFPRRLCDRRRHACRYSCGAVAVSCCCFAHWVRWNRSVRSLNRKSAFRYPTPWGTISRKDFTFSPPVSS